MTKEKQREGDSLEEVEHPSPIVEVVADDQALVPLPHIRLFEPAARASLPPGMATKEQLEVFRELRTRLTLMASSLGLTYFTTLVVPLTEGSGASFVARNLAATFTLKENLAAVLIDCDFGNPTQRQVLESEDEGEGLSDYLEWGAQLVIDQGALIKKLILPTAVPGLHLIPAGRREAVLAGRPREYFSSMAMRSLMRRLRAESCCIFLDGPPIAGSPDARILSELADLVILVVGYGRSTASAIAEAAAIFDPTKFAGVVFNERPPGARAERSAR